jgi:hypothetical protein
MTCGASVSVRIGFRHCAMVDWVDPAKNTEGVNFPASFARSSNHPLDDTRSVNQGDAK